MNCKLAAESELCGLPRFMFHQLRLLTLFGWSPESVAAEDAASPAVSITLPPLHVAVSLPDRKTVSTFTRNADGDITHALQLETDAPHE